MQLHSIPFLFYFLPCMLAVYYIVPRSWRSGVLTLGSLVFYWIVSSYQWWSLALLVVLTVSGYFFGLILSRYRRTWVFVMALVIPAGTLVFFKYYNGGRLLPVGLSFYVFQILAYLIDVYRERLPAERGLLSFGAQTVMFPKLLSGPLMNPKKLQDQEKRTRCSKHNFHMGLQELILGLSLKVLLADRVGGLWAQAGVIGYESITTPFAWMALVAYAMRLYFDFYGYSLMAIGLGHMLGYNLPMNFLDPYCACSVSEFYRRWHATLGAWFREYIYIPLGGNRKGLLRTICNLAVVWLLTGIWHGTTAGYLVWAGFLFLLIVNERLWLGRLLKHCGIFAHVYTVIMILLSWVPFAIGSGEEMAIFFSRLFSISAGISGSRDYLTWGGDYTILLAVGVVLATPLPRLVWRKIRKSWFTDCLLFILFWAAFYCIATAAQDPFLYFQY